jgi:hypothetical protein
MQTYRKGVLSAQSTLQAVVRESAGHRGLVGVRHVDNPAQGEDGCNKHADLDNAKAGIDPCIHLGRQSAEDIVVLVELQKPISNPILPGKPAASTYRFSEVPTFLLVPPVAVRVPELALLGDGIDVSTVLANPRFASAS